MVACQHRRRSLIGWTTWTSISAGSGCCATSSLTIPRGQTLAMIGESGCGKTVLLKTIIGLLRPTARRGPLRRPQPGRARRAGTDPAADPLRLPLPAGGAVRQHDDRPERRLSAAAAHAARARRRSARIVSARLAEVGLPENILGKKAGRAFRRHAEAGGPGPALAMEPEIMLYDEPTTGLDPIMSDVINELILSTRQHHPVTSIVVTHDMRTAQKVADRVVMLYPLSRLAGRRAADPLRRPGRADRAGRRQPGVAVRPRRGRRAADGNAAAERGGESWTNV